MKLTQCLVVSVSRRAAGVNHLSKTGKPFFPLSLSPLFHFHSSAFKMTSMLQKLILPIFSGPPEPPRNKVTVVGVGQVGMACAVSILLKVRKPPKSEWNVFA